MRSHRGRGQGRAGDLLLASHYVQHGARVQHEHRSGRALPRGVKQQGRGRARPHTPPASQAAQILSVGYLPLATASKTVSSRLLHFYRDLYLSFCYIILTILHLFFIVIISFLYYALIIFYLIIIFIVFYFVIILFFAVNANSQ